MNKFIFTAALALVCTVAAIGQEAYNIKFKAEGFEEKELYLGYFYGDKQYLKDTTTVGDDGYFTFKGEEALTPGIYLIVLPPDNKFFQVLINEAEQKFTIDAKYPNLGANPTIKGSKDNQLLYTYLTFLNDMRTQSTALDKAFKSAQEAGEPTEKQEAKLKKLNEQVLGKQKEIVAAYPNTLTAAIIKANMPLDEPETLLSTDEETRVKRWRWNQKHYFDNLDLDDPRMLRTPFLFPKVMDYVEKMVVQHPDTINLAIDRVLEEMKPAEETFKFYLIHFLNKYANGKIVGQDAIYVHLVDNYYAKGLATWTEQEQLDKIVDEANKMKPTLIGKIAPNIKLLTKDKQELWLHGVESPYTVMMVWDPDCGHCKKSMPDVKKFYEEFKDKGVEIFAICNKSWERDDEGQITLKEVEKCWDYIEENEINGWINIVDPYNRSRYKQIYNIRSTPQIFILDKDKKIVSKKIAGEQLSEVMNKIIEMDQQKWEQDNSDD